MPRSSDWRLRGQEAYLAGVELARRQYRRYPENESWDHDHCEFCYGKFMEGDDPDILHQGYCTLDEYRWICEACFNDFRARFKWRVVASRDES